MNVQLVIFTVFMVRKDSSKSENPSKIKEYLELHFHKGKKILQQQQHLVLLKKNNVTTGKNTWPNNNQVQKQWNMTCITCTVFVKESFFTIILTLSAPIYKVTKLHLTMAGLITHCFKIRIRTPSTAVNPKVARRTCFKK